MKVLKIERVVNTLAGDDARRPLPDLSDHRSVAPPLGIISSRCVLTSRMRAPQYPACMWQQELIRGGRSPYVEQSFARVVVPSPSCCQENTQSKEALSRPACYCDILSYLDFRPWGIFSTGTHAAACNFMTPPIEALVSTRRSLCVRTIMYIGCIAKLDKNKISYWRTFRNIMIQLILYFT